MKAISILSALILLAVSAAAMPATGDNPGGPPGDHRGDHPGDHPGDRNPGHGHTIEDCKRDCSRSRDSCEDANRRDQRGRERCEDTFNTSARKPRQERYGMMMEKLFVGTVLASWLSLRHEGWENSARAPSNAGISTTSAPGRYRG
ncbi:hypothetical protein GQ53DRAFT_773714 [Thozetella sp. PMI_491]|nr:hypothetical protein GQ53DRAFT_773714 [Thozetella sp. PMI_491]